MASHTFSDLSSDPDAIFCPSGLYATENTVLECPFKVLVHSLYFASHTFTVWSADPDTIYCPSELYVTEFTVLEYPINIFIHSQ